MYYVENKYRLSWIDVAIDLNSKLADHSSLYLVASPSHRDCYIRQTNVFMQENPRHVRLKPRNYKQRQINLNDFKVVKKQFVYNWVIVKFFISGVVLRASTTSTPGAHVARGESVQKDIAIWSKELQNFTYHSENK